MRSQSVRVAIMQTLEGSLRATLLSWYQRCKDVLRQRRKQLSVHTGIVEMLETCQRVCFSHWAQFVRLERRLRAKSGSVVAAVVKAIEGDAKGTRRMCLLCWQACAQNERSGFQLQDRWEKLFREQLRSHSKGLRSALAAEGDVSAAQLCVRDWKHWARLSLSERLLLITMFSLWNANGHAARSEIDRHKLQEMVMQLHQEKDALEARLKATFQQMNEITGTLEHEIQTKEELTSQLRDSFKKRQDYIFKITERPGSLGTPSPMSGTILRSSNSSPQKVSTTTIEQSNGQMSFTLSSRR